MPMLSATDIDNMLITLGEGRTITVAPGNQVELIANLPVKFTDPSQREDLATGQVVATRPQVLARRSAVEGHVNGGH